MLTGTDVNATKENRSEKKRKKKSDDTEHSARTHGDSLVKEKPDPKSDP